MVGVPHHPLLPSLPTLRAFRHKRPFEGYPSLVFGAIASFLEPFCEHLSPKGDQIFKIDFWLRFEGPCVETAPGSLRNISKARIWPRVQVQIGHLASCYKKARMKKARNWPRAQVQICKPLQSVPVPLESDSKCLNVRFLAPHHSGWPRREYLLHLCRRTVNLRRPERARNEGTTGLKRLDDTQCTTYKRRTGRLFSS